jgi:NAD(P)-dependent dehydrogenase (short-subunit alcohol dehydrogenase family)
LGRRDPRGLWLGCSVPKDAIMKRVKDKTAIITGAALGIGEATSLLLAQEGAKVAITDMKADEGRELARRITALGGVAEFWRLDVSREADVKRVFSEIRQQFGQVDILVNNAGIVGADKPTHKLTEEEWDEVQAVNVKGVFFCTKHAVPHLQEAGGGSIVNISSIYGIIGAPDIPAYHASKAAVRVMTKTDALLYVNDRIRVNSIHPGYIWTPLVASMGKKFPDGVEAFRKHLDSLHPVGHVGEPNDVAYGILYLASDESKFVTGAELVIDGGYTAR